MMDYAANMMIRHFTRGPLKDRIESCIDGCLREGLSRNDAQHRLADVIEKISTDAYNRAYNRIDDRFVQDIMLRDPYELVNFYEIAGTLLDGHGYTSQNVRPVPKKPTAKKPVASKGCKSKGKPAPKKTPAKKPVKKAPARRSSR